MVTECKNWLTEIVIWVDSKTVYFMATVSINGAMAVLMRENFVRVRGRVREHGREPMEIGFRVNIMMI